MKPKGPLSCLQEPAIVNMDSDLIPVLTLLDASEQGDLMSFILLFQNKESRLKLYITNVSSSLSKLSTYLAIYTCTIIKNKILRVEKEVKTQHSCFLESTISKTPYFRFLENNKVSKRHIPIFL
jgi:hypothetical protein